MKEDGQARALKAEREAMATRVALLLIAATGLAALVVHALVAG